MREAVAPGMGPRRNRPRALGRFLPTPLLRARGRRPTRPPSPGLEEAIGRITASASPKSAETASTTSPPCPACIPELIQGLGELERQPAATRAGAGIIVEKPFGRDLDSAIEPQQLVRRYFDESQVYRIDHYLGKGPLQNIMVFRFANGIFEPIWNRHYIDNVQITVSEDIGVGHRGAYYEEAGAMRDMVQNHLLQLLALVGDGASRLLCRGRRPQRKGQSAQSIPIPSARCSSSTQTACERNTAPASSTGSRSRATRESPTSRPIRRPKPTSRSAGHRQLALGRRPLLLQTGKRLAAGARRRSPSSSSGRRTCRFSGRPCPISNPTASSSTSNRSRASRSQSAPRCRGRKFASATSTWSSCTSAPSRSARPTRTSTSSWSRSRGYDAMFTRGDEVEAAWRHRHGDPRSVGRGGRAHPPLSSGLDGAGCKKRTDRKREDVERGLDRDYPASPRTLTT